MLKAYKDTTFFLITQARTYFFYKKVSFCAKNAKLSTSNFQLSTIFCTFVPYFGIIWAFYKKIRYSLFIVHYSFHCCLHVLHSATTIPRVRTATTVLPLPIPPIRILRFRLSTFDFRLLTPILSLSPVTPWYSLVRMSLNHTG